FPALPEQEKIAGVLSKIQKAVENQEKIVADLRELKAATIAKLFREGLSGEPMKNTEIGEIPRSWHPSQLSAVCAETETLNPAKTPDLTIEYVDVSSVSREECRIISSTKYKGKDAPGRARKLVKHRDVIFATVRPTLRRVALIPKELDNQLVSTAFCVIRAIEPKAYPEFLYYLVSSPSFISRVGQLERGANYPAVTDTNVFSQDIPLPGYEEQQKIADKLLAIDQTLSCHTAKARLFKNIFTSALSNLMTGKIRMLE
ncbi:MAG: restriction endonuclease subunit S, partial [Nitrospirae bacterium]|nr:restriction endonuclease subunit S [Nitrospirota bacterium]